MPKKIKFESFRYQFLSVARRVPAVSDRELHWSDFLDALTFKYVRGKIELSWAKGTPGKITLGLSEANLYFRGDTAHGLERQKAVRKISMEDSIKVVNDQYFTEAALRVAREAGFRVNYPGAIHAHRFSKERDFHDAWADQEDTKTIDVVRANEVCTAPEMRFISHRLGDLKGKKLLDVGCGLGEASVYFALKGALVKSMDISGGMLDATRALAIHYGVTVDTHQSAAEELLLHPDEQFDVIYAGNLLHHVDIAQTLSLLKPHLSSDGVLVTWDPLDYNPAINVYRRLATQVRTEDEHPLRWADLKMMEKIFPNIERRYFWLTTLIIFVAMALVQRRNPNKERFWKVVVEEGDNWAWIYKPLEVFDRLLLRFIPPLRLLCWNVVIFARLR